MRSEESPRLSGAAGTMIPALTGLRWVAAFCVWLHHFPPPLAMPDWAVRLCRELHIGVPVFFVLSGFLITLRYSEQATLDPKWLGRYARNRVARIYPVYFLLTLVTLVAVPLAQGGTVDGTLLFLNLTLLRGFFDDFKFTGVAQGWTLTVEECFYFLAPLLFLLWCRRRGGLWLTLAGLYLAGLALWGLGERLDYHGLFAPFRFVAFYTFFGHAFSFLAGAWLARRFLAGGLPVPRAGFPLRTVGGALGLLSSVVLLSRGQSEAYEFGALNPLYATLYFVAIPIAVCFLIAGLCMEKGSIAGVLGSRPLVLLGKASYCFYLVHVGVPQRLLHRALPKALREDRYWFEFLGLVLLSIALYLWFERPMNRWLRGRPGAIPGSGKLRTGRGAERFPGSRRR